MENNEALVKKWNENNLIGCDVAVRMDNDSVIDSRTRSAAFVNTVGEAVIFVDCFAGYYLLSRVRAATESPNAVA